MPFLLDLDVEYLQGIHITDSILWLDALRRADLCFLSHAHVEPLEPHRKILLTEATAALVGDRLHGVETLISPYRRHFSLGGLDIELHPSGHMLGAAQIQVDRGESRLVYTGDFQPLPLRTTQPGSVLGCDVLVMQARYGQKHEVWPDRKQVEADLLTGILQAIGSGKRPVLFAEALGQAQELACFLEDKGLEVCAQDAVYRACRTYSDLGVVFSSLRRFRPGSPPRKDEVLLFPPRLRQSKTLLALDDTWTAVVSGQALDPLPLLRSLEVDAAFPLSMHADHPGLLSYVHQSKAKKIYLVGRAAKTLASELRSQGHHAWALQPPEQLEMFHPGLRKRPPDRWPDVEKQRKIKNSGR